MPEKSVASPTAAAPSPAVTGIVRFALELTVVTAIFAAAGAWPTPDTNEAHYLSKARHAFDPSWGGGDFFLESREAHGVFYRLLGPLAAAMPLERTSGPEPLERRTAVAVVPERLTTLGVVSSAPW
jgi:hypothetical protein